MSHPSFPIRTMHRQRGVAIIVALMVLVAMSLGAIALMRSVDTAALIAGNLAFRQGATLGGDVGLEEARTVLLTQVPNLTADSVDHGYYASTPAADAIDLTGNRLAKTFWVKWPGTDGEGKDPYCLATDTTTGNQVCYIIHRLCDDEGPVDIDTCYTFTTKGYGGEQGSRPVFLPGVQTPEKPGTVQAYYRITVRTQGPRNNISFLQAFVVI